MTQMTGPDCAVMCNLINIHTYIHEGGREAKKRKKAQHSCRRRAGNGRDMAWVESKKNVEKKGLVQ